MPVNAFLWKKKNQTIPWFKIKGTLNDCVFVLFIFAIIIFFISLHLTKMHKWLCSGAGILGTSGYEFATHGKTASHSQQSTHVAQGCWLTYALSLKAFGANSTGVWSNHSGLKKTRQMLLNMHWTCQSPDYLIPAHLKKEKQTHNYRVFFIWPPHERKSTSWLHGV